MREVSSACLFLWILSCRRASYLKNSTVRRRLPTTGFRGRSRTPPRCSQESKDVNVEREKEEIERKKREDEEEAKCWAGEELWILRARMQFAVGRILHHLLSAVIEVRKKEGTHNAQWRKPGKALRFRTGCTRVYIPATYIYIFMFVQPYLHMCI